VHDEFSALRRWIHFARVSACRNIQSHRVKSLDSPNGLDQKHKLPVNRIFIPTRSGSDWQPLLAKPVLHWKKGASAMTTAASWEAAAGALPPEISALLDSSGSEELGSLKLLAAIPEWETVLESGVTTSKTDVLALCRNGLGLCVVAVEAKVNEDFGPLIKEKRDEASSGQSVRLEYLQSLFGLTSLPDSIRYQLLHRTASAVLTGRLFHARTAVMLVQSFGNKTNLRADFDNFRECLHAQRLRENIYSITAKESPKLFLAWCQGDPKFLEVELPPAPQFATSFAA
jgi:hypothetical protein